MTSLRPILLVEDNPDDERLTFRALRRGNLANEILIARNGEEALNLLFALELLPCVVLLDLKLPKIDGLEVLRRIRANERTRLQPVVILTSSSEDRDIIESYSLGANSYVQKPVEFEQFTEAVHQLGLYWALINEPPPESLPGSLPGSSPGSSLA
jgi:two-component system response regulator